MQIKKLLGWQSLADENAQIFAICNSAIPPFHPFTLTDRIFRLSIGLIVAGIFGGVGFFFTRLIPNFHFDWVALIRTPKSATDAVSWMVIIAYGLAGCAALQILFAAFSNKESSIFKYGKKFSCLLKQRYPMPFDLAMLDFATVPETWSEAGPVVHIANDLNLFFKVEQEYICYRGKRLGQTANYEWLVILDETALQNWLIRQNVS